MSTASASPQDIDLLRDRTRLYLQVILLIDIAAYVSDFVTPLLFDAQGTPEIPEGIATLRYLVTAVLLASWSLLKFTRAPRLVVLAFEVGVTVGLSTIYVFIGEAFAPADTPAYGPVFTLFGVMLLLGARAALIPSHVLRTLFVGAACMLPILISEPFQATHHLLREGLTFMGVAFVGANAVTSHVIYGLRRQVRDALRLGQYELQSKLGEGGMGVVYRATHVMLRRPTAVKLLPIDKAGAQTIARFEREVTQTSRLEHPNSVSIYDYGRTPDGQFYYAMEYVEGFTLEELVELDGPVPAGRVVHILLQAARAIAEAHTMGLVHRDIKPANIMLCVRANTPDTVKVLDFGLVKAIDDPVADGLTNANVVVGTPSFLAPEAITDPDDVGAPSDVYALGAVGYFLLTGRDVFEGRTVIEVCSRHLNDTPEPPSDVLGRPIDAELEALILRCLVKRPEERPADGAALAAALEALALEAWTTEDAAAWWQTHEPSPRDGTESSGRSMLAVDVAERR
ncbi:MAG: serine/threonine-protein kinase [Deltaproteobacteria bacterium]